MFWSCLVGNLFSVVFTFFLCFVFFSRPTRISPGHYDKVELQYYYHIVLVSCCRRHMWNLLLFNTIITLLNKVYLLLQIRLDFHYLCWMIFLIGSHSFNAICDYCNITQICHFEPLGQFSNPVNLPTCQLVLFFTFSLLPL